MTAPGDLDPRTPVLVGCAAIQQQIDDPAQALEPVALMVQAVQRAAEHTGVPGMVSRADAIWVSRGFWDYSDPGRLIAERVGAGAARTGLAEIGVLQTTLLGTAAQAIASGEADVVVVAGGEAKYRALRAQIAGVAVADTPQADIAPDVVLRPAREIWSPLEEALGLLMPVNQYAIIETALRAADGADLSAHRRAVAELWAAFSRVAAENPLAWSRTPVAADDIAATSRTNRMLAFPYGKRHPSQWNVDQAAGLIFCAAATARQLGIPESRWVFPLAVADSNHMVPLSARRELHRSPGFRIAGQRVLAAADLTVSALDLIELYSCFPVAVRIQARELDIPEGRPLTITGGMPFAGGPLNNFVFQAAAQMAQQLTGGRGRRGMVTAVSGMLTKQGVSLWSSLPPQRPFAFLDVTTEVAAATQIVDVVDAYVGPATIAAYTVLYEGDVPVRAVAICDLPDGRRTLAETSDQQRAAEMTVCEYCGRGVVIEAGRRFSW
jgi:acetyl-CoA C-acetyltransferase